MQSSKLKKTLALINFVVLFIVFLLYRNGNLEEGIDALSGNSLSSPNGGAPVLLKKDSLAVESDSLRNVRMSSSKSMILPKSLDFPLDTGKRKSSKVKKEKSKEVFLPSTKSGSIAEPDFLENTKKSDSTKKQKTKTQKD